MYIIPTRCYIKYKTKAIVKSPFCLHENQKVSQLFTICSNSIYPFLSSFQLYMIYIYNIQTYMYIKLFNIS